MRIDTRHDIRHQAQPGSAPAPNGKPAIDATALELTPQIHDHHAPQAAARQHRTAMAHEAPLATGTRWPVTRQQGHPRHHHLSVFSGDCHVRSRLPSVSARTTGAQ